MKRILLIIMALYLFLPVSAGNRGKRDLDKNKEGLNIFLVLNEEELEENLRFPEPYTYTRLVREARFVKYGIDIFERSVYRDIGAADYGKIADVVIEDADDALAKEIIYREGRLVYALLQMPPVGDVNRFVALQGGKRDLTVIYMEGKATLEELRKLFAE